MRGTYEAPRPLRAVADGPAACRQRPYCHAELSLREERRRAIPPAHRRHRYRTLEAGIRTRDHRGYELARHDARSVRAAVGAFRCLSPRGREAEGGRASLSLLRNRARTRSQAQAPDRHGQAAGLRSRRTRAFARRTYEPRKAGPPAPLAIQALAESRQMARSSAR